MSHEHEQKHRSPRAKRREEAKRRTRIAVPFFAVLFALTIVAFILPLRPTESREREAKADGIPRLFRGYPALGRVLRRHRAVVFGHLPLPRLLALRLGPPGRAARHKRRGHLRRHRRGGRAAAADRDPPGAHAHPRADAARPSHATPLPRRLPELVRPPRRRNPSSTGEASRWTARPRSSTATSSR